jgi:NAD(P)-dependent dehydrogenase (short-subunit alcohol dehydrogenase family)
MSTSKAVSKSRAARPARASQREVGGKAVFRLDGQTAVVTGGLGRIGAAIAAALAGAGARVVVVDQATASRAAVRALGRGMTLEVADISVPDDISQFVSDLDHRLGGFSVWVNCAYPRTADWGVKPEQDLADSWRRNVEMQMVATCLAADHAAQRMAKRNGGSIINTASIYGVVGPDFGVYDGTNMTCPAAYSAIKGGIIGHTRYLASYYGRKGVRANVICPGGVAAGQTERFVAQYSKRTALGRMAKAEELGPPAVFLASAASSYVTGTVLMVDGGWTAI